MARPIKETPVLMGQDAKTFAKMIERNEQKKVPITDFNRAKNIFKSFKLT